MKLTAKYSGYFRVVPSVEHYDTFYKDLSTLVPVSDISSSFAMERIKSTTALPLLDYA